MFNTQEGQTSHSKKFNCDQHVYKIQFNEINLTFGEGQSEITIGNLLFFDFFLLELYFQLGYFCLYTVNF